MDDTTSTTTVTQLAASPAAVKLPRINWNLIELRPFKDFAEVKGPAMKKADEAIVTAASSEFVNTSGSSSDSNSLENQLRVLCERMGKEREAWEAAERHTKQVAKDQEEKKRNTMLTFEDVIIDPTGSSVGNGARYSCLTGTTATASSTGARAHADDPFDGQIDCDANTDEDSVAEGRGPPKKKQKRGPKGDMFGQFMAELEKDIINAQEQDKLDKEHTRAIQQQMTYSMATTNLILAMLLKRDEEHK
jgi:hypothetical protein